VISRTIAFVTTTYYLQHWFRSLLYNSGSGLSHFTSDCTLRQTNYLQHWLRSVPLYLRPHSTPGKLPTTVAQVSPTLPQTAQYARQTTYNSGLGLPHFTSDCTVRQTNYLQQWLRSLPLYLRLHSTPDKLPTTVAQVSPTLPQTAQYARQTTYNSGSGLPHFTSDCTVRQSLRMYPAIAITDSSDVATHTTCTFPFTLPSIRYKHMRLDDRHQSALHTAERLAR